MTINQLIKALQKIEANHLTNFCINLLWPQFEQMREALKEIENVNSAINERRKQSFADWELRILARASLAQLDAFMKGKEEE